MRRKVYRNRVVVEWRNVKKMQIGGVDEERMRFGELANGGIR